MHTGSRAVSDDLVKVQVLTWEVRLASSSSKCPEDAAAAHVQAGCSCLSPYFTPVCMRLSPARQLWGARRAGPPRGLVCTAARGSGLRGAPSFLKLVIFFPGNCLLQRRLGLTGKDCCILFSPPRIVNTAFLFHQMEI